MLASSFGPEYDSPEYVPPANSDVHVDALASDEEQMASGHEEVLAQAELPPPRPRCAMSDIFVVPDDSVPAFSPVDNALSAPSSDVDPVSASPPLLEAVGLCDLTPEHLVCPLTLEVGLQKKHLDKCIRAVLASIGSLRTRTFQDDGAVKTGTRSIAHDIPPKNDVLLPATM